MSELRLGQDRAYLERKAKDEGLVVFLPEVDEVFLDLDLPNQDINQDVLHYIFSDMDISHFQLDTSSIQIGLKAKLQTKSKSGNSHIYLKAARPLSHLERVIFQVCLGSDPIKELFSFIQLRHIDLPNLHDCECPIALFETPTEAKRVEEWRRKNGTTGEL